MSNVPWSVREKYLRSIMQLQTELAKEANLVQPGESYSEELMEKLLVFIFARANYRWALNDEPSEDEKAISP